MNKAPRYEDLLPTFKVGGTVKGPGVQDTEEHVVIPRYILLASNDSAVLSRGWNTYYGAYGSIEEIKKKQFTHMLTWYQIVDMRTKQVISMGEVIDGFVRGA